MGANQFVALFEQADRGTVLGSETKLFLPVMGNLKPEFAPTDESRKEFRGAPTTLGDSSVIRRESQWTYSLECAFYPGPEVGLLLKHLLGKVDTRAALETTAYKGILYALGMPYGAGAELGDKAIGLIVNSDEGGATQSRTYYGARVKSMNFKAEGTDDIKLVFELAGAGEWIDAAFSAETAGASFPSVSPYCSSDLLCYIGAGITRTGTAPDYTDLDPNTMPAFRPDSVDFTITNGLADKVVMNGVKGPSHTYREGQFAVELSTPIDYDDPSSGFSSSDEVNQIFAGVLTNGVLLVLDNGELAGDTTENYQCIIDFPYLLENPGTPQHSSEGTQATVELAFKSLFSDTTEYPIGIMTVDQEATY